MSRFELYRFSQGGRTLPRIEMVASGDMKAISTFVKEHGLTAHHDPKDPFSVCYSAKGSFFRVVFRLA